MCVDPANCGGWCSECQSPATETPDMDKPWTADLWDAIDEYVRVISKISGYKLEDGVKAAAAVEAVVNKIAAGGYSKPVTVPIAK